MTKHEQCDSSFDFVIRHSIRHSSFSLTLTLTPDPSPCPPTPSTAATASARARPLKYAQYVTFREPLELELGGRLPEVTVAFETYGRLNRAGRQRRADLPRPVGRFARRPARRRRRSRLVGHRGRAGQADRHRSLLRDLPEHAGRLPRHDRAQQHQPGDRPALRHRFPRRSPSATSSRCSGG